jgi:periplasmic copper chaperone A
MWLTRLLGMTAALMAVSACVRPEGVIVKDAWVRATVPGQEVAGAYMRLTSAQDAKVIGADSRIAKTVEFHATTMDNNVMRMHRVPTLDLPAGQTVALTPGGLHIMLLGLSTPLRRGESVPLTLHTLDAQGKETAIELNAAVRDFN